MNNFSPKSFSGSSFSGNSSYSNSSSRSSFNGNNNGNNRSSSATIRPHNLQAEEAVLGAMLLAPEAVARAFEIILSPDYFFKPSHQLIYAAMRDLYQQGASIDPLIVADKLKAQDESGDMEDKTPELIQMQSDSPAPSHVGDHAKLIKDDYIRRNLLTANEEVIDMIRSRQDLDINELIDSAEQLIYNSTQERLTTSTSKIFELLDTASRKVEALHERKETITGLATGYKDLDEQLSGLQPGTLVVVGARPAMGKTSFALGAACHIAGIRTSSNQTKTAEDAKPVLFFSLEMGADEISRRILGMYSRVPHNSLRTGRIASGAGGGDWARILNTVEQSKNSPLYIDDNPGLTVMEVRAKARRLQAELDGQLGAVFVDYMQLMSSIDQRAENRQVEVSAISRNLKILARELNCPVVALSQLSRNLESRSDKRPVLADLRESGSIEQDADVVIFIYRDEEYNTNTTQQGIAEIRVSKHRTGPTGFSELTWKENITKFENHARQNEGGSVPEGYPPEALTMASSTSGGSSEAEQAI